MSIVSSIFGVVTWLGHDGDAAFVFVVWSVCSGVRMESLVSIFGVCTWLELDGDAVFVFVVGFDKMQVAVGGWNTFTLRSFSVFSFAVCIVNNVFLLRLGMKGTNVLSFSKVNVWG